MEGRWIYPTPGYRPEKVSAEVSEGNVRKQISEAGQGGKQQAVLRPLTEITLVSIENIKKIYIHSNKTLDTNVLGSITQNTVVKRFSSVSSVQSLSCVRLFMTPWITAHQTSLSITNSQSLLKLMSIELVMPSSHLILCRPLLLLPPIPPSIRVFSNESVLRMRWPKYWSFSFSSSPSSEHPGLISFRMDWLDLLVKS